MITIYRITSPSGKVYVGQTVNVKSRMNYYRILKCKGQWALLASLTKYGFDQHKFEVLEEVDVSIADAREIHHILVNNSFYGDNRMGMNLNRGGNRPKLTQNTKDKLSLAIIGGKHYKSKKLYQYNLDGTFIKEWECMKCIERELGIPTTGLSNALKSGNYCRGSLWSYTFIESLPKHTLTKSQERYL